MEIEGHHPDGTTTVWHLDHLEDDGVIAGVRRFSYTRAGGRRWRWNAGEYVEFRQLQVRRRDRGARRRTHAREPAVVRITDGRRLADAFVQIAEQMPTVTADQLQETLDSGAVTSKYKPADVSSWEGLLFPDTYQFEKDATPQLILQTLASKMEDVLDELGYDKAEALQGRTAYELITIASLIEKETGAPPEERGKISRVISNRLEADETLGIDASILYGLGRSTGSSPRATSRRRRRTTPGRSRACRPRRSRSSARRPGGGDRTGRGRLALLRADLERPAHALFTDSYNEFLDAKNDAQERGVF